MEGRSPVSRIRGPAKTSHPNTAGVLARERLFRLLDRRRRSAGIWVGAGAGCGKTTLVASYLRARGLDSCWYQLDVRDSDVADFFRYLSCGMGKTPSPALPCSTSEYNDELSAYARGCFRTLFSELVSPFVLVLDDYHAVSPRSALHGVVEDAIAEAPPKGCVVVISRSGPPPSMARLRANRGLETLGWEKLRLTRQESDAIVEQWDDSCNDSAREQLYEKTQGWVAGLILMLDLSVADGGVAGVPSLSSRRLVFDYLATEVLHGFNARTRLLLLRTALLNEMTPAMASTLASEPRAGEILEGLHRDHHLVNMREHGGEPVYRCHPLLADMLRVQAEVELAEGERRSLRRRARTLLESAGAYEDLAALLRSDEDWHALARLALSRAPHMIRHGQAEALEQWLDAVPEEQVAGSAWFHYWRAACCARTAPREARRRYQRAFELFGEHTPPDRNALLLTCSGAMEAILFDLDNFEHLDAWIEAAIALLDEDAPRPSCAETRVTVSLFLALVLRQPFHPVLQGLSARAHQCLHAIEDPAALAGAQCLLAIALNCTGEFTRARQVIRRMAKTCRSPFVPLLASRALRLVEAMYHEFAANRDNCLEAVTEGLEIGRAGGARRWTCSLLANGAGSALGVGDVGTARELLAQARDHLDSARPLEQAMFHYYSAWLDMLRGDPVAAFRQQRIALDLAVECGCTFFEDLCRVAMAQVLSELGDGERALSHLSRARARERPIRNRWLEFHELLSFSQVALKLGRSRQGLAMLRRALEVGRENGYTHCLWWLPSSVSSLCARALNEGIEVGYVTRLVRERRLSPEDEARYSRRWPWRFRIHTFGGFEVIRDDKDLGTKTNLQKKPLELLKTLVGFGALNVSESRLAGSLWPRIDADYAYGSLTTTLHRLRKLLGEDRLISLRHGHLSIDTGLCWMDLCAFEAVTGAIEEGRRFGPPSDYEERAARWSEELFALYRGPFMSGEGEHPRFLLLRGRLRDRFLRAVGELARYWETRGEWERAAECYERGIEGDELAEGLYRRLMLCYRELGRVAQAIDMYDYLRSILEAERAVEPAPETTLIYHRLVDRL